MKQYLLAFLFVIGSISILPAQRWAQVFEEGGSYLDVKKTFKQEWEGKPYQRSSGYKQFKRLENFYDPRLYPDYKWPDPMIVWKEMEAAKKAKKNKQSSKSASTSTWTPIGPTSWTDGSGWNAGLGRINVVMVDPNNSNTIYVGAPAGGLWKSTNGGNSWNCLTDNQAVLGVSDMEIDPNNSNIIYLATGDGDASDTYSVGVLKSTNGGTTWTTTGLNFQVTQTRRIRRLIMHPTNSNILFAATTNGLYKTSNGGNSWTLITSNSFQDLAFKPGDPTVVYAVNDEFYKSTNTGNSFTQITSGLPPDNQVNRYKIGVSEDEPSWVYLVCGKQSDSTFKGMYRSTNSGNSFTLQANSPNIFGYSPTGSDSAGQSWYDLAIVVDPNDASTMWVGGVNIWKSTDGGVTYTIQTNWTYPNSIGYTHADIHYLNIYNGDLYCGSDGGVFISSDGGDNWTDKSAGLQITQFYRLSTSQTNPSLVIGGTQDNGTNLYTGSNNWTHVVGADGMECIINPTNANTMFAAIQFGSIRRSTNGGNSFSVVLTPDQVGDNGGWVTPYVLDPNNPNHIYVGYTELYRSTNGGNTFTQISNLNNSNTLRVVEVCKANSSVIYLGRGSKVFKSSNGGTSFTNVTGNLPNKTVTSIITDPTDADRIWVSLSGYTSGQKVFFSSTGGSSWTNLSTGLPNLPANCLLYREGSSDEIYCGTDVGIYTLSGNSGSWTTFGTGLPNVVVEELEITYSVDKIRAATYGRGMWEADLPSGCATDVVAPVITCPNNVPAFFAVGPSSCEVTVTLPVATATDDCTTNPDLSWRYIETDIAGNPLPGAIYSNYSTSSSSTFEVGYYEIDWQAEDESGNSSNCDYQIEIRDDIDPVPNCINHLAELDANGSVSILQTNVSSGPTDNCGVSQVTVFPNQFDCSDLGTNDVTVLVLDENGNTASCTSVVNVIDGLNPTASCIPSLTIGLSNGSAQITPNQIDNGSTDNCSLSSLTLDQTTFDCDDLGSNIVTLNVFDANGNQSDCFAQVIVESFAPVVAVCQNIDVFINGSGSVDVDPVQVDGGSAFDCGNLNFSLDISSFDCLMTGPNDVILTVDNGLGDSDDCTAVINVADQIPPVLLCSNVTASLDSNGQLSLETSDLDNGSFDNCDLTLAIGNSNLDCSDIGTNTVILTGVDASGNSSACSSVVTVVDDLAPTAVCLPNIDVTLNPDGTYVMSPLELDNGSIDNCSGLTYTLSNAVFDCDDIGDQSVNLTVEDVSGNQQSCASLVTVLDGSVPAMLCSDITISLDATGSATIIPEDVNGGSAVSCGDLSLELSLTDFDCSLIGVNAVILTGTSDAGNQSSCNANVQVLDNQAPVVSCNTSLTVNLDQNGQVDILPEDVLDTASDNCSSSMNYTLDVNAFTCADLGTNAVTLSASDAAGNIGTCSGDIIVQDQSNPIISCQDLDIMLLDEEPVSILLDALIQSLSDNCDSNPSATTADLHAFGCADAGDNAVLITATDASGNSSDCIANVNVSYDASPVAVCNSDIVAELNGAGVVNVLPSAVDAGSYALCEDELDLTLSQANFTCEDIGSNLVQLFVAGSGGLASCNVTIEVVDLFAPTISCNDLVVELGADGTLIVNPEEIVPGTSDNCSKTFPVIGNNIFDCSSIGTNLVISTVTDASGNFAECTSTIEVLDVTPPVAICNDISVLLDENGVADIDINEIGSLSFDLCGSVDLQLSNESVDCSGLDVLTIVTLTVTDESGNETDCDSEIEVIDSTAPIVVCQNAEVYIGAGNIGVLEPTALVVSTNDNCSDVNYELSQSEFDCEDLGNQQVTLSVFDASNNVATCTVNIEVLDDSNPLATCYSTLDMVLDVTGNVEILLNDIYAGDAVSCNGFEYSIEPQNLDCSNLGLATPVILTIGDSAGTSSECSSLVTVTDVSAPVMLCSDLDTALTDGVEVVLYPELFDAGSYDACGPIQYVEFDSIVLNCSNIGQTAIDFTVVDAYGNTNSCEVNLNLSNNMSPIANCVDLIVYLDENGIAQIDSENMNNGSTDACGNLDGISLAINIMEANCDMLGVAVSNELTVTDINSGITSACISNITVLDEQSPIVESIPEVTPFEIDGSEPEIFNVSLLNALVEDNCAVTETLIRRESGDCEDSNTYDSFVYFCPEDEDGLHPVTFRALDESGNATDTLVYVDLDNLMVSTSNASSSSDAVYCSPNPFFDVTNLYLDLAQARDLAINLYSLDGKLIERRALSLESGNHVVELELSDLPAGLYYCSLNTDSWNEVVKLIKVNQ